MTKQIDTDNDGQSGKPMREYSPAQELINNTAYIVMILLGAAILITGYGGSAGGWISAIAYLAYGIAGSVWIMVFVCPYCRYFNTRSCPCGYGRIAARFCAKKTIECFDDKFKKHIPVIVPLWFIPIVAGAIPLIRSFSLALLFLIIIFAINAFIILPLVSTKHGCKECPQKSTCPWMKYTVKQAG
ncbi:MAG: hypothetical protein ACYS3S_12375 [Planctomycetota bacterium]|jgi:hypothetical protein